MTRRIFFALALCLLALPARADLVGRVVRVSDGDTLTVLTPDKREVRVRLHGIDAPEKGQPYAAVAKRFLSDGVFGQSVRVIEKDTDRYGRTIGVVLVRTREGRVVEANSGLVQAGLAWAYVKYSRDYVTQEAIARRERLGVWRDPAPEPPWEWRKAKRAKPR